MNWRFLISSILVVVCMLLVVADTLNVAGHTQRLTTPLIVEKDEVLAPIIPSLRLLGARVSIKESSVNVSAHDKQIQLRVGATEATVGKEKTPLMAAPRDIDGTLYLPTKALARLLDADVQFDAATHALTIMPVVTVSYEQCQDTLAILVHSAAPLQFTNGAMEDRAFFDFRNVSLALAEQQIPVAANRVERLRLSQYSVNPSVVRLVCDFSEPASVKTTVNEQGRLVTILIDKPAEKPMQKPMPDVTPASPVLPEAPQPAKAIKLLSASLRACSSKQSELILTTDGSAQFDTTYNKRTRELFLKVNNGVNAMPSAGVRSLRDRIVEQVQVSGNTDDPGAQVAIKLKQDAGYSVRQDDTSIHILMGSFDINDMTIVLDAGHGGHDVGAVGVNRTFEKNVNLAVILRAADLLRAAGATVLLSRPDDTFIPLNDRPALANGRHADLFISVHCNSTSTPNSGSGTQTYYRTPQSASLAAVMHQSLINELALSNGGVRTANYLVIRKSTMPAVLLELGFINNTREEALLGSAAFQQKAAQAILDGVRNYALTKDWQMRKNGTMPDPTPVTPAVDNTDNGGNIDN